MTDLCYNCGGCHLPRPCLRALESCETCGNLGHTWNFCHRGPMEREPDYKYFALCHNCDKWHLPQPCDREPIKCMVCQQLGHLQFFCPVKPLARNWQKEASETAPPKRARGTPGPEEMIQPSHALVSMSQHAPASNLFSPQQVLHSPAMMSEVYTLKMTVVRDVLELVKQHHAENVLQFLSQAYAAFPRSQYQTTGPTEAIWSSATSNLQPVHTTIVDYETPTRSFGGQRTMLPVQGWHAIGSDAQDEAQFDPRLKNMAEQPSRADLSIDITPIEGPSLSPRSQTPMTMPLQPSGELQNVHCLRDPGTPVPGVGLSGLPPSSMVTAADQPGQPRMPQTARRSGKKANGTRAPRKSAATKAKAKEKEKEKSSS